NLRCRGRGHSTPNLTPEGSAALITGDGIGLEPRCHDLVTCYYGEGGASSGFATLSALGTPPGAMGDPSARPRCVGGRLWRVTISSTGSAAERYASSSFIHLSSRSGLGSSFRSASEELPWRFRPMPTPWPSQCASVRRSSPAS